jgi:iron complex outermembrane receptor protein
MLTKRTLGLSVLMGTILLPAHRAAIAQTLEEVIVTAQRREQNLQEVPISVEAFTGVEIQQQGYRDLKELGTFSPSVYIQDSHPTEQDQSIRGFGTFGRNLTLEQAVPIFVDGIHFGRPAQIKLAFLDPARVEVLKGPQPVFFGQNATAGAFNIVSAGPTPDWEGYLDIEAGNFEYSRIRGAYGGPLTDRLGIRVAGTYEDGDGFIDDVVNGGLAGAYENIGGRVILEFEANDRLTLTGKVEYSKITRDSGAPIHCLTDGPLIWERGDEGIPARDGWQGQVGFAIFDGPPNGVGWADGGFANGFGLPTNCGDDIGNKGARDGGPAYAPPDNVRDEDANFGLLDIRDAAQEWFARSTKGGSIDNLAETLESPNAYFELDYQMENDIQVTWLTGYSGMDRVNVTGDTAPFVISPRERSEDFTQYSSELRFTSGPGRIEWMTGLFWQDTDLQIYANNPRANITRGMRFNDARETQEWKSIFGTLTFNFMGDRASLDVGGRWTDLEKFGWISQVSAEWIYDVNPCDPRGDDIVDGVPGTGDNNPATCGLHPDAAMATAADALFLLPGADVDNLWYMPYREDRYIPSSWIGGRAQAVGMTIPVDHEGPFDPVTNPLGLDRHGGPFSPTNGGNFSQSEFMPQVTFRYRPNDDHSLFARYAESFKAGGFDTGVQSLPADVDELRFEPESGWTIEFGSKGNLWDGRARYDVTVFSTTFEDFQVQSATGLLENPFIAINAGEQRVRGIEAGLTAAVTDDLTLSVGAALMDGEFTYFPDSGCNQPELRDAANGPCRTLEEAIALGNPDLEGTIDRSGTPSPKTPDYKVVFGIDWVTPIFNTYVLTLNARGYISDGFLTDTSGFDPVISMDEHEDLNLTVGIGPANGPWVLSIYGRNLLEPQVTYHPEDDVQDDGLISQYVSRNSFATYGLKFQYNFGL